MDQGRDQLQSDILDQYRREHEALGDQGTLELLERGRAWNLSGTLANGGVIVFPHAGVADCGHHTAAAVHACLDRGANQVLVVSVLHAFPDKLYKAPPPTWVAGALIEWQSV
jgi:predicted class III extradiol MEMO1 family dioxygenase